MTSEGSGAGGGGCVCLSVCLSDAGLPAPASRGQEAVSACAARPPAHRRIARPSRPGLPAGRASEQCHSKLSRPPSRLGEQSFRSASFPLSRGRRGRPGRSGLRPRFLYGRGRAEGWKSRGGAARMRGAGGGGGGKWRTAELRGRRRSGRSPEEVNM